MEEKQDSKKKLFLIFLPALIIVLSILYFVGFDNLICLLKTNPTEKQLVKSFPQIPVYPESVLVTSSPKGSGDACEKAKFENLSRGLLTHSISDYNIDGYADLEEFLNGIDPKIRS